MTETTFSLTKLQEAAPLFASAAVAIGNFDGVHRGHVHVLRLAVEQARETNSPAVALTFDPHPRAIVGDGPPPALTTAAQRRALIRAVGVEATVTLRFDRTVAGLSPEQFVERVLVRGLGAQHVVVGDNFRFGRGAQGTRELLEQLGRRHGYSVQGVPPVQLDNVVVSSSVIRKTLLEGAVRRAADLLGRPYELVGTVIEGEGRGASLGFPTANVEPETGLLVPGSGVYVARALDLPALAVIGDKPTFGLGRTVLEVHILDFDQDLRGRPLRVKFLQRLRDTIKFNSSAELRLEMISDAERARQYFRAEAAPGATG